MITRAADLFRNFSFSGSRKGFSLLTGFSSFRLGQLTERELYDEGYAQNFAVFSAVSKIADKCATIPLKLYEKNSKGELMEVTDDPVLDLLDRPNPKMDYPSFVRWWVSYYLLSGNSIVHGVGYENPVREYPSFLFVYNPENLTIKSDVLGLPEEYRYSYGSGRAKVFEVDPSSYHSEINHTMKFNPLANDRGMSPLLPLQLSIMSHNESKKFMVCFMRNRAVPSGALVSDKVLTDQQMKELRKEIEQSYQSSSKAGQPMILSGGVKWVPFIATGSKGQFHVSDINDDAKAIALALGLPPVMLGVTGDSTYNNIKEAKLALVEETCIPIAEAMASSLSNWLVTPKNKKRYLWPCVDEIPEIQDKKLGIYERIDKLSSWSLNEKRKAMDKDEKDGRVYDSPLINPSLVPADDYDLFFSDEVDDEDAETLSDQEDEKNRWKRIQKGSTAIPLNIKAVGLSKEEKRKYHSNFLRLRFGLERRMREDFAEAFRKQGELLAAKASGMVDKQAIQYHLQERIYRDTENFEKLLASHYRKIFAKFREFTVQGFKNSDASVELKDVEEIGSPFESALLQFVLDVAGEKIQKINKTTLENVRSTLFVAFDEGLSELEMANAIEELYSGFSEARARNIARTETGIASNTASRESAKSLGITSLVKGWLTAGDGRVRDGKRVGINSECQCKATADHAAMDGVEIPINQKFKVPGKNGINEMEGPGDQDAPADQVCGCRCVTYYGIAE